jgi:large subunit ribosomal protein L32
LIFEKRKTKVKGQKSKIKLLEVKMPNPKRRHSKSRTRQRRAHDALKVPQFYIDKDTGEAKKPHRIDAETGTFKGRQIIDVKETE